MNKAIKEYDLVVIGGGSAGMAGAIAAYEKGIRSILIIEKNNYLGGILDQCIHNGFGLGYFKEELTGPEFMSRLAKKVKEYNIEVDYNSYVLSLTIDKVITASSMQKGRYKVKGKAVIIALGCYERNAGSIMLTGDRPAGIYTAGQAQLYLNNFGYIVGKNVFILGSGDIGLITARRMKLEGANVIGVAELMPYSNGLNRNIVQCLEDYNIPLYLSTTVKRAIGKDRLEAIELVSVDENLKPIEGSERLVPCDTLLLSVGLVPNTTLIKDLPLTFSKTRGVRVSQNMESDIPGLFSAGNVLHVHDLVDLVVYEGIDAGLGAYYYLNGMLGKRDKMIEVKEGEGINYLLPQVIYLDEVYDNITLKLRVKKPYKDVYLDILIDDKIIKSSYHLALIPSEMHLVKLNKDIFKDCKKGILSVKVRQK